MPVTNYYTINGKLRGEETGGVRTGYLTDALGSITATISSDGVVQNTYRYKPFGQQLAKTGVGIDPKFRHAGESGSRITGLTYSEQYNQNRHRDTTTGRWTTVDRLWPDEPAYGFAHGNPTTFIDPSGLQDIGPVPPGENCGKHPPGTTGFTECNFEKGQMYSLLCDPDPCTSGCNAAHEAVHRKDFKDCCALVGKCIARETTPQGKAKCITTYKEWEGRGNMQISECNAYNLSYSCLNALQVASCCVPVPLPCCDSLTAAVVKEKKQRDDYCAIADAWRKQRVKPCPFNKDGSIKK